MPWVLKIADVVLIGLLAACASTRPPERVGEPAPAGPAPSGMGQDRSGGPDARAPAPASPPPAAGNRAEAAPAQPLRRPAAAGGAAPAPSPSSPQSPQSPLSSPPPRPAPSAAPPPPAAEVRTRHATFRHSRFDELPGWERDDLVAGWPTFRRSCAALVRRDAWRELCTQAAAVSASPGAVRAFFESHFALLRILNTDASREGDITGYFEPLLEGRRQPQGGFTIPVLGVPRDLYTLDWMTVPAPLRGGAVPVRAQGQQLVVLAAAEPGSAWLDLRRFELDTKDRRLRVRLSGSGAALRAEPYPSRGEMLAQGLPAGVDAPVLAWVDDALALYAMQIQGSGRIRLDDATVLRVQYADQNGHPFKPLRVVAQPSQRVVTRSIGAAAVPLPDEFVLEDEEQVSAETPAPVLTRGLPPARGAAPPAPRPGPDAATAAVVEQLLGGRPATPPVPPVPRAPATAGARPAAPPAQAAPAPIAPPAGVTPKGPAATAEGSPQSQPQSQSQSQQAPALPATGSGRVSPAGAASMVAGPRKPFDARLLAADPSFVFFKVSTNQAPVDGPTGALGVPLTPGRSVAVDPRVTPLGYPVFLAAPPASGAGTDLTRLVFAQDTGGAIRGAVRADFFWGFGPEAGRLARGTRQRGQMWLLMPKAEAAGLRSAAAVVTRSLSPGATRGSGECLVADEQFCQEPE